MLEEQDIKLNYRVNISLTFIFFAFFIVITTISIVMFYWTKLSTENFQNKVIFESKNIVKEYHQKENLIENTALGLKKGIFDFTPNQNIIFAIFKTYLFSNKNFIEISYIKDKKEFFCNKNYCNSRTTIKNNKDKFYIKKRVKIDKNSFIEIKSDILSFFKSIPNDIFNLIIVDKKGKILFTNFIKTASIYDIFTHNLVDKILLNNNKFVTNDIYVKNLDNYKLIFIQNKKLLQKQKQLARNLAITMLIISVILSIIFGYIFSKPLYHFYEELDRRVKKEIEKNREKEQILMHQSKLASLGEMLGNIAHQWRHPLTRLSLLIQNFEMAYKMKRVDEEFILKFKNRALEQINYMSNTIDDFTNFFKKDKEKQIFLVDIVIEEALKLLEGRLKGVKVVKEYQKLEITGYKTEFSQVILNILNNAIDVLNEREVKDKTIFIRIDKNIIEIEDNGGGIKLENINQVFEPYFTTKFQSQGTGIGLYMSKIIITKHFNAKLEVRNSEKGAIFRIELSY